MFIRYFLELPMAHRRVVEALMLDPQGWLPEIVEGATRRGDQMLVDAGAVGEPPTGGHTSLEFGAPLYLRHKTILPMRWVPDAATRPFPALDADVEIAGLGETRTQLAVSARLADAPSSHRSLDRGLLFRVAEATLKDFLDRVGAVVMAKVGAA